MRALYVPWFGGAPQLRRLQEIIGSITEEMERSEHRALAAFWFRTRQRHAHYADFLRVHRNQLQAVYEKLSEEYYERERAATHLPEQDQVKA